jgi:hypothetical protein
MPVSPYAVASLIFEGVTVSGTLAQRAKDNDKGLRDPELKACMTTALHDAILPKSRSGIITVQRVYDGF